MLGHPFPVNEKFTSCYNYDEYQKRIFLCVFPCLMKRLEPRQLLVLAALGRNSSIHSAARDLSLTQSAVSKALAEIEAQMGATLFTRSRQGIEPTALGKLVLRRVGHLLDVLDRGAGHHEKQAPVLKIGYISDLHGMALGNAFVRWRQSQSLKLRLLDLEFEQVSPLLLQADLDAVLLDEPMNDEWTGQLRISSRVVPVLRTHHPLLKAGKSLSPKDVQALDWILPTLAVSWHRAFQDWTAKVGMEAPARIWKIPAGHGLSTVVAQSDAVACLPAAQASFMQQAGVVRPIELAGDSGIDAPAFLVPGPHVRGDPALHQTLVQFAQFLGSREAAYGE